MGKYCSYCVIIGPQLLNGSSDLINQFYVFSGLTRHFNSIKHQKLIDFANSRQYQRNFTQNLIFGLRGSKVFLQNSDLLEIFLCFQGFL